MNIRELVDSNFISYLIETTITTHIVKTTAQTLQGVLRTVRKKRKMVSRVKSFSPAHVGHLIRLTLR